MPIIFTEVQCLASQTGEVTTLLIVDRRLEDMQKDNNGDNEMKLILPSRGTWNPNHPTQPCLGNLIAGWLVGKVGVSEDNS